MKVQTRAQFEKSQQAQVNQLLGLVYALLALAVVIALIGIVNTLMLSVFERTHEIGLLRAVGMKRRQVRAMIRSESVILAVFGALIGIVVGTGLGIALVASLKPRASPTSSSRSQPGGLPHPRRTARSGRRQLAGPSRRQARRPDGHRRRLIGRGPIRTGTPTHHRGVGGTAARLIRPVPPRDQRGGTHRRHRTVRSGGQSHGVRVTGPTAGHGGSPGLHSGRRR